MRDQFPGVSVSVWRARRRKGRSLDFAPLGLAVGGMFQVHSPASRQERESCLVIIVKQHCPGACSAVTEALGRVVLPLAPGG